MPNLIRRIRSKLRRQKPVRALPETEGRTIEELHKIIDGCQIRKHLHGEEHAWRALVEAVSKPADAISEPKDGGKAVKENVELRKALETLKKSKLKKTVTVRLLAELAEKYHNRWVQQREALMQAITSAENGYHDHHLHEFDLEAIRFHIATSLRHRQEGPVWNALYQGLSRPIPKTLELEKLASARALHTDNTRTALSLLKDDNSALSEEEKTHYNGLFNALLKPRK